LETFTTFYLFVPKMSDEKKMTDDECLGEFGKTIATKTFKEQSIFFMNAYWMEHGEKNCKDIWLWTQSFEEFSADGKQGPHDLDDFQSARFLERHHEPMTVIQRRKLLKSIDADSNNRMGILEFLVFLFKVDIPELMRKPQGTNQAMKDAEKALATVMDEINKIEQKKADLKEAIKAGGVKGMRARAELALVEDADPLPLNRALITAEAKLRKTQKSKDLSSMGQLWWMQNELAEAKAYKPKGGVNKKKFEK